MDRHIQNDKRVQFVDRIVSHLELSKHDFLNILNNNVSVSTALEVNEIS